jgi:hypothetical protein
LPKKIADSQTTTRAVGPYALCLFCALADEAD